MWRCLRRGWWRRWFSSRPDDKTACSNFAHRACVITSDNCQRMTIEISNTILDKSGLTTAEILLRLAIILFQEERMTLGQASELAGMHQIEFQRELSERNIPIHYGREEFEQDIKTLEIL